MEVRDAVEADADQLAAIADVPTDVMRNVIHDRTVRVAERAGTTSDPNADTDNGEAATNIAGFVSFDADNGTVHVTQFGGTTDACELLLSEPLRFAASEGMGVELLVVDGEEAMRDAAEAAGFEEVGAGPRFAGETTTRFRVESP